jgi:hypothetical protein
MAETVRYIEDPPRSAELVIIIGGGIVGAATAFHASRAGLCPVLLERHAALCTNDQERSVGTPSQSPCGEQRERGGPPGGSGTAVEDAKPRTCPRLHHDYLVLDGGQFTLRVPRIDRYQLGDRQLVVHGGHYEKIAAFGQGQDDLGGRIQLPIPPSIHNLPDGVCQLWVGQAGCGLSRVEDLHRYSPAASR